VELCLNKGIYMCIEESYIKVINIFFHIQNTRRKIYVSIENIQVILNSKQIVSLGPCLLH